MKALALDACFLLAMSVSLAAAGPQAGTSNQLPEFSAADQLSAARELCGPVSPGTAARSGPGEGETVAGFLTDEGTTLCEVLLSAGYDVRGVPRHVFVVGGHYVEDGRIYDSHGQTTTVGLAVLEVRDERWTMVASDGELTEEGQNGYAPGVSLQRFGEARYGVEVASGFVGQGYAVSGITLFDIGAAPFRKVLSVALEASDCGKDESSCFTYEGTLQIDAASGPDAYDLRLTLKGTYRNRAGRVVPIPADPLVLRMREGTYQPLVQSDAVQALWRAVTHPTE